MPHGSGLKHVVRGRVLLASLFAMVVFTATRADAAQAEFSNGHLQLAIELLNEQVIHVAVAPLKAGHTNLLQASPMIAAQADTSLIWNRRSGPDGEVLSTSRLSLTIDPVSLCIAAFDLKQQQALTRVCPSVSGEDHIDGLSLEASGVRDVYGLGQQFQNLGEANGNLKNSVRSPGDMYGNHMTHFAVGDAGNTQLPIMYALGQGFQNHALMVDAVQPQTWDFTARPWHVDVNTPVLRWYLIAGDNLPDLRHQYMNLTGHPPVPPRKMFGLWVSEFGYRDWGQVEDHLHTLRAAHFPVDGFVLDLFWFGGIHTGSENSRMGSVDWDLAHFPDPAAHLQALAKDQGIGIIPIEESYISRGLPEHEALKNQGYLVRNGCATCEPVYLIHNPWWGLGGMIDWTNPGAGDYWHDTKREPLIRAGVAGHWIDLGEPEAYGPNDWAWGANLDGHQAADFHNIYNFSWAQSIARGYQRHGETQRPFIMSRSGTSGIQRFGVAMWSGDVGSRQSILATHENARMHMSLSGIDYFGSDIGGFHRGHLQGAELDDLYTRWFALSAWLDVPLRPHTDNLCRCEQTAPDRIGNRASNLANLRLRYQLIPYFYALAHQAWLNGDPLTPPLVYAFQSDLTVREMGDEKMLGPDLLVDLAQSVGSARDKTYLPAGMWFDFRTGHLLGSSGQWFAAPQAKAGEPVQLPVYARAGAIIPMQQVDENTLNAEGRQSQGAPRQDLVLRVFPAKTGSHFTLFEDDGHSIAYQQGAVRQTELTQQTHENHTVIGVAAARGSYAGAPVARDLQLEIPAPPGSVRSVRFNDRVLLTQADAPAPAQPDGWFVRADGWLVVQLKQVPVDRPSAVTVEWVGDTK